MFSQLLVVLALSAVASAEDFYMLSNMTEAKGLTAGMDFSLESSSADDMSLESGNGEACTTPQGSGTCEPTRRCRRGTSVPGYCPGGNDIQCCVTESPGPTPPTPTPSNGNEGLDFATAISSSTMSCMASSYSFVIPRGYRSSGSVDSNACSNIKTAKAAGIKKADSYMFPCPTCSKSATTQVGEMVNNLNSNCKREWSGRVWLDIEGSQYWKGSSSANKAFYEELVGACKKKATCGVYSSASQWSALFGSSSYSYGSDLPLWYAHYDNKPSFSDYSAFGGWSKPFAKQYAGDVTACSTDVDKNYAPRF
jgi:hypothetical protein